MYYQIIYTFNHYMDIGSMHDPYRMEQFRNKQNFSYFAIDDFWGLKQQAKELKKPSGFFDFSGDQSQFKSIE